MDSASFTGVLSGLALIVGAIFLGGEIHNFWNLQGFMIVLGGTVAATLITFQLKDVFTAFKAEVMVELCTLTRRQGLIAMGKVQFEWENAFLRKACNLIMDGAKEDSIRDTLNIEIESMKQRHLIIQDIFRKMAVYAPSFGMIGTLIGLIQMLSQLSNPETIGPSMAVALLTTFYGVLLATLFFLPIAGKLKDRTLNEVILLETVFEGAISIMSDNNPLLLYEKLSAFIPEKQRRPMRRSTKEPQVS
ncbi:MAG: motility protein A [Nitrospinaceae bacterium]